MRSLGDFTSLRDPFGSHRLEVYCARFCSDLRLNSSRQQERVNRNIFTRFPPDKPHVRISILEFFEFMNLFQAEPTGILGDIFLDF